MKIRPQQHLINILTSTKQHHPNFTLFLGAGASISSGVDSAGGMIRRLDWPPESPDNQYHLNK
jgi:hypothetical protein